MGKIRILSIAMFFILATILQASFAWQSETEGKVGGYTKVYSAIPNINTTAYASGYCLGNLTNITNAVRTYGGTGIINSFVLTDTSGQSSQIDIVFFNQLPSSTFTDHTNFSLNDVDLTKVLGTTTIYSTDYINSSSGNSVATVKNLGLGFQAFNDTSIYEVLVCRGTPTYEAATSIQVTTKIFQD